MKTDVLFLYNAKNDDLFAYFPKINESWDNKLKLGYSNIGQHSEVHVDYAKRSKKASFEQYKELKTELEAIGYKLNVLN